MTDMQPESAATGDRSARGIAEGLAALAEWSCQLGWRDVPGSVRRRIAAIFADDLSAIVAAREEPELAALVDALARSSGPREASLFDGSGRRLDRYSAALANGSAADWCELDSGYRRAVCHGGIYCMPALLAEGEVSGAALEDMLLAFVVGYETVSRIARAFEYDDLAIHPHGSLAAVGAAATIAALRRLPAGLRAAAISSAATLVSPGPFGHAVEGALIRNVWPGIGASTGLRAVDWAELGIAGSQGGLHDVYGTVFGGTARPEALTEGLGQSWAASDGYHKLHACCQYSHAAVEAALEIAAALPRRAAPEEIRTIRVDTHWRGRKLDNVRPATTLAAKFSMQHVLATVAVHGHAGAAAFRASTLADPAIAALRERVAIGAFEPEPDWPNDRPARVSWELADGTKIVRECLSARGGPDRPFTEPELRSKIAGIVAEPYPGMVAMADDLLALSPALLARPWRATVAAVTASARAAEG